MNEKDFLVRAKFEIKNKADLALFAGNVVVGGYVSKEILGLGTIPTVFVAPIISIVAGEIEEGAYNAFRKVRKKRLPEVTIENGVKTVILNARDYKFIK